jgi:hypothetical protein
METPAVGFLLAARLDPLAPGPWSSGTARPTTYKRHPQSFCNQDRANVATVSFQCSATSSVIARRRSFRSRLTCTWHKFKIEAAASDKLAKSPSGLGSQITLRLASRTASFWGVESDETHVWLLMVNADSVPVDYVDICGINVSGNRPGGREKENENRELAYHNAFRFLDRGPIRTIHFSGAAERLAYLDIHGLRPDALARVALNVVARCA